MVVSCGHLFSRDIFWVGFRATGGQGRLKALVARVNERAVASLPGQTYKPTHPRALILKKLWLRSR